MPALTTEDLLNTPTGQQMVKEAEEQRSAEQAAIDAERSQSITQLQRQLVTAGSAFEVVREQVVTDLDTLAALVLRLAELKATKNQLVARLQKLGGEPSEPVPVALYGPERRKLLKAVEIIRSRLLSQI